LADLSRKFYEYGKAAGENKKLTEQIQKKLQKKQNG